MRIFAFELALAARSSQKIDADHTFTTHKYFFGLTNMTDKFVSAV